MPSLDHESMRFIDNLALTVNTTFYDFLALFIDMYIFRFFFFIHFSFILCFLYFSFIFNFYFVACNSAFEQGYLEPWRYMNAFIIIIIIIHLLVT